MEMHKKNYSLPIHFLHWHALSNSLQKSVHLEKNLGEDLYYLCSKYKNRYKVIIVVACIMFQTCLNRILTVGGRLPVGGSMAGWLERQKFRSDCKLMLFSVTLSSTSRLCL